MSTSLSIANVVNVSASTPQPGIGMYNTGNLAIFTRDTAATSFGTLGYKQYLSPTQVGLDFGTSSNTFAMANAIFSQQPNILIPGGYLVIIPFLSAAQVAVESVSIGSSSASLPATSGSFVLNYGASNATTALPYNATAAAVQTALRLLTGLTTVTVSGSAGAWVVTFTGVSGAATLLTITSNTVADASTNVIVPTVSTTTIGSTAETLDAAINRSVGLVQYFGAMAAEIPTQTVLLAAAAVIQPLNKQLFVTSITPADVATGGMLDLLRSGTLNQTRGVPYFDVLATALVYQASYASLALSTNFQGSNTTQTMHLKTLVGVQPDPTMTQTLLAQCQAAGADVYCNIQGVSKVFCSGANGFFDDVNNLLWFGGALQVALFNALATTNTKIPQTESGMLIIKGAARVICEQAITNQFLAAGTWNSPNTFGNLNDLILNVGQRGYYIYTAPIASQSQAVRVTRAAPLMQIAIKYAGAIHSATCIVNINQ